MLSVSSTRSASSQPLGLRSALGEARGVQTEDRSPAPLARPYLESLAPFTATSWRRLVSSARVEVCRWWWLAMPKLVSHACVALGPDELSQPLRGIWDQTGTQAGIRLQPEGSSKTLLDRFWFTCRRSMYVLGRGPEREPRRHLCQMGGCRPPLYVSGRAPAHLGAGRMDQA